MQPCDDGQMGGSRGRPRMAAGSRDSRAVAAMVDGLGPGWA